MAGWLRAAVGASACILALMSLPPGARSQDDNASGCLAPLQADFHFVLYFAPHSVELGERSRYSTIRSH